MRSRPFLFIIIMLLPLFSEGQPFHLFKLNRTRNGERQGLWVTWQDSAKKMIGNVGRFKKGNEKGVWKYYSDLGVIEKKEVYRHGKIKTTLYYYDGTVWKKGFARFDETDKELHYYWYGPWEIYSRDGKLEQVIYYKKGKPVEGENEAK